MNLHVQGARVKSNWKEHVESASEILLGLLQIWAAVASGLLIVAIAGVPLWIFIWFIASKIVDK